MKRRTLTFNLLVAIAAVAVNGCSPLAAFNALVPKDSGVIRVITDSPFGRDPRQRLDIYRPMTDATNLPIVVFFYGGSWNSGTKTGYSWVGRALAARGFVVVIPDYRLVPKERYPGFVEDGAGAVELAVRLARTVGGDPSRIVLSGHSAGAYIAAMLAYDDRWLGANKSRIRGFAGLAGPYDFLPLSGAAIRAAFAGTTDLDKTQPINFAGEGDPPAFLATAADDRTVDWKNSDNLEARLKAVGVKVERKRYPGIGHAGLVTAIARPLRGRAPVLDDLAAWIQAVTAAER